MKAKAKTKKVEVEGDMADAATSPAALESKDGDHKRLQSRKRSLNSILYRTSYLTSTC